MQSRDNGTLGSGYVPAAPVLSGTFVTPESALGVAAIFCAVNLISTDTASMPVDVCRKRLDGGLDVVGDGDELSDLQDILHTQPNDEMDAMRWRQTTMSHVLTRGNGPNEIVRKKGRVQSIWPLHPAKTIPKYTEVPMGSNERPILYYELDNKRRLAAENCLHFAGMGFNGVSGYSPITVNRQTVGISIGQEQYQAAFFGNNAKPSGWIKMVKKLTQAAQENWRKTFNQIHQGSQSAHQIGFLEEGMDWVQNNFSPEDAELILGRGFQVLEVCRIYRVPPNKLGDYSQSHISSTEEANLDYVSMTLYGWVCMMEAQMNLKLLTREQRKLYTIRIDMTSLLRGNVEARMKRIETMRNTGAWSVDDILLSEGQNPIGEAAGGKKHLVQIQYVDLKDLGKMPAAPPIPGKPEKKKRIPALELDSNGHTNGVN